MRLYLIATILIITVSVLSEVSAKQKPLKRHSVAGRKELKKNSEKHRHLKGLDAGFHENKRRSKRQNQPEEETPTIEKGVKDVIQTENKLLEDKVQITKENQEDNKKKEFDNSSSSESNESGPKNGKTRRSIRGNTDVSDSKSDESKETQKPSANRNKIRRSLKEKLNRGKRED